MSAKASGICYWCGNPAASREHVPPQGIFPPGQRNDLITVPSCAQHNEKTSKLDEKFRFYLQACAEGHLAFKDFEGRTMRGLRRPESKGFVVGLAKGSRRVVIPTGEETIALQIKPQEQDYFFEKIVRGLYFHLFGTPAPGRVATASTKFINPGLDYDQLFAVLRPHITNRNLMVEHDCKNPDVFQFRYVRVIEQGREAFCVVMRFYKSVEVLGLVAPESKS